MSGSLFILNKNCKTSKKIKNPKNNGPKFPTIFGGKRTWQVEANYSSSGAFLLARLPQSMSQSNARASDIASSKKTNQKTKLRKNKITLMLLSNC
jgi:hypothetical protein